MQTKVQREWADVRKELNERLARCEMGPEELKNAADIDYYAARRSLISPIKNRTRTALALCELFSIKTEKTAKVQTDQLVQLKYLLTEVWDGSTPHAELLAKLIKSTKPFKVEGRTK